MSKTDLSLGNVRAQAEHISNDAQKWIVPLARFGFVAKGVVYIIIGILAALAAFGSGGKTTDSRGAFEEILSHSYGKPMLGAVCIGLIGYAIWRIVQAIKDTEDKGSGAKGLAVRGGYFVIGLIHLSLAYSAASLISGSGGGGGSSESQPKEWTAFILEQSFGELIVIAIGLGFIGFAASQFYKAYTTKFREKLKTNQMSDQTESFATKFGQFGLSARGVVFGIIGIFLILAGLHSNANEVRGLSGALRALLQQSYGQILLGVVAIGLIAYGLYMFVLARYRRMVI